MTVSREEEINQINEFVEKRNFHAAYNVALSAMNECRRNNDQAGVDKFIGIIKDIVNSLDKAFGSGA